MRPFVMNKNCRWRRAQMPHGAWPGPGIELDAPVFMQGAAHLPRRRFAAPPAAQGVTQSLGGVPTPHPVSRYLSTVSLARLAAAASAAHPGFF